MLVRSAAARATTTGDRVEVPAERPPDPFGATTRERVLRRLAGAGVAIVLAVAVLAWWFPPAAAIAVVGILLVGVPLSWVLERRRPSRARGAPLGRYALVGAGATVLVLGVLGALTGDLWLWVVALYGLPVAIVSGLVASASATHLPERLLVPVAGLGLLVGVVILPVLWWWQERPPAPYDYLVVNDTPEVRAVHGDAVGLARAVAVELDTTAAGGRDRRAHDVWIEVSDRIAAAELGDHEAWVRMTPDEALPTRPADGQTVRRIDVIIRDAARACVTATRDGIEVSDGPCRP